MLFLANILYFFRLWQKLELDLLVVCCYAAMYSAFNKIEHSHWSLLSRRLAGVTFPAVLEGDTASLEKLAGLTEKERQGV